VHLSGRYCFNITIARFFTFVHRERYVSFNFNFKFLDFLGKSLPVHTCVRVLCENVFRTVKVFILLTVRCQNQREIRKVSIF